MTTESGTQENGPCATDLPEVEVYTPERIAEFLLNSAVSKADYQAAIEDVISMGIDPTTVLHDPI